MALIISGIDLEPIDLALQAVTDGPWVVHEHLDTDHVFGVEVLSAYNGGTWPVADMQHDVGHPDPYGQIRANAHLIANAPAWLRQMHDEIVRLRGALAIATDALQEAQDTAASFHMIPPTDADIAGLVAGLESARREMPD